MVKIEKLLAGVRNKDPKITAALDSVYNIDVCPRLLKLLVTFADRFPDRDMVSVLLGRMLERAQRA